MKEAFKIGEQVYLTQSAIEWYLSDAGQDCFFPPSGELDKSQQKTHDEVTVLMLSLAMNNDIRGSISNIHYHDYDDQVMYEVRFGKTILIQSEEDLLK